AVLAERESRDRAPAVAVVVARRLLGHRALVGVAGELARARLRELVRAEQPGLAALAAEDLVGVEVGGHVEDLARLRRGDLVAAGRARLAGARRRRVVARARD